MTLTQAAMLMMFLVHCAGETPDVPRPNMDDADEQVVRAVEDARAGVHRRPASAEAWGALADRLMAHGWRREAAACYLEAERLQPSGFDWPYLLGHALSLRDVAGAQQAFERAVSLDPTYIPARIHLAETLIRLDRFDDAHEQLEAALAVDPEHLDALLAISGLELDTGRPDEARERLERAYESDPRPSELHRALARVYLVVGENDLARRFAALAESAPPRRTMEDPRRARALPRAGTERP